jgi:hypothetical protein
MKCAKCSNESTIGSRCGLHWLQRQARLHGIANVKWFLDHEDLMVQLMVARYTAIAEGYRGPDGRAPDAVYYENLFARARTTDGINSIRAIVKALDRVAMAQRRRNEQSTS